MSIRDMRARVNERINANRWYDINNLSSGTAVVRIYDEIGFTGVTAEQFAGEIAALDVDEIEVRIASPGGGVFDGIAIFNALRAHPARVTTRVDGLAASIASVVAQAGDHRVMLKASQMMIHEAWGMAVGPAGDLREFAELLDRQTDVLVGIYASRSGGDPDKFRELLAAGTWLSDQETVDLGLADEVVDPTNEGLALADGGIVAAPDEAAILAKLDDPDEDIVPLVSSSLQLDEEELALKARRA